MPPKPYPVPSSLTSQTFTLLLLQHPTTSLHLPSVPPSFTVSAPLSGFKV
uniref:Uncharacterized protein n=1 Tax=Anguilla anguilla TaxID=7936 RepID=A0A0E9PZX9_ANGAN